MKFFILYRGKVSTAEVPEGSLVRILKDLLRRKFSLQDVEQSGDKKLALSFNTICLQDDWVLSDVGVPSGSTLHFYVTTEKSPALRILCIFSGETVNLYETLDRNTRVTQLKRLVMSRTGVPYSVFRLSYEQHELFECHSLGHYGVSAGSLVKMETWDGWNNFLNSARRGQARQTADNLMHNDVEVAAYQKRVALFIASHLGHTDLAAKMIRMGAHADEPVGEHPARRWCTDTSNHMLYTSPVHEAAINGHLTILRLFVRKNSSCVAAKDGRGLTPLDLAKVHNRVDCVSYLKQQRWRKSGADRKVSHSLFAKMRHWKEKSHMKAIAGNNSMGDGRFCFRPPMVGSAIYIDGLHESMQKSRHELGQEIDVRDLSDSDYEVSGISSYNSSSIIRASNENTLPNISTFLQLPRDNRKSRLPTRDTKLPPLSRQSTVNVAASSIVVPIDNDANAKGNSKSIAHHLPCNDMLEKTKNAYEQYCGKSTEDSVLACMDIASSFSTKPWLSQVRLAMAVHRNTIRRPHRRSRSDPAGQNDIGIDTDSLTQLSLT